MEAFLSRHRPPGRCSRPCRSADDREPHCTGRNAVTVHYRCRSHLEPQLRSTSAPTIPPLARRLSIERHLRNGNRGVAECPLSGSAARRFASFSTGCTIELLLTRGRTRGACEQAREHLRAVVSWAWEQDLIDSLPRFPKPRPQRGVAGRHYLTKAEINALYFATHQLQRPRGWKASMSVGKYWRAALVVFFNYGIDYAELWIMRSN